ncbi:MAG: hypothetical protein S4CHLAM123_11720 [Chlamydiales bacterium]|nr:hypothetical protein [Chlamydiales bacterium]
MNIKSFFNTVNTLALPDSSRYVVKGKSKDSKNVPVTSVEAEMAYSSISTSSSDSSPKMMSRGAQILWRISTSQTLRVASIALSWIPIIGAFVGIHYAYRSSPTVQDRIHSEVLNAAPSQAKSKTLELRARIQILTLGLAGPLLFFVDVYGMVAKIGEKKEG